MNEPYQKTKDKYSIKCCNCGKQLYHDYKKEIEEILLYKTTLKRRIANSSDGKIIYNKEEDDGLVDVTILHCTDCADISLCYYIDGTFTLTQMDDDDSCDEK